MRIITAWQKKKNMLINEKAMSRVGDIWAWALYVLFNSIHDDLWISRIVIIKKLIHIMAVNGRLPCDSFGAVLIKQAGIYWCIIWWFIAPSLNGILMIIARSSMEN